MRRRRRSIAALVAQDSSNRICKAIWKGFIEQMLADYGFKTKETPPSLSLSSPDVTVATFLLFPELEFTSAFFMLSLISFLLWLIEHLLNVPCIYIFGHICCPYLNVCAQKKTTVSYSSL